MTSRSVSSVGGPTMAEVALALGSNVGDSAGILQGAVDELAATEGLELLAVSRVYRTDPVGGPEQDDYLNAVVLASTSLTPLDLLARTQRVEQSWHRTRDVRWGPRTLDIDILSVGTDVIDEPDLVVPHPRAHERAFVLVPWADVAPDAMVGDWGSVRDLLAGIDRSGVRATELDLRLPVRDRRQP